MHADKKYASRGLEGVRATAMPWDESPGTASPSLTASFVGRYRKCLHSGSTATGNRSHRTRQKHRMDRKHTNEEWCLRMWASLDRQQNILSRTRSRIHAEGLGPNGSQLQEKWKTGKGRGGFSSRSASALDLTERTSADPLPLRENLGDA